MPKGLGNNLPVGAMLGSTPSCFAFRLFWPLQAVHVGCNGHDTLNHVDELSKACYCTFNVQPSMHMLPCPEGHMGFRDRRWTPS